MASGVLSQESMWSTAPIKMHDALAAGSLPKEIEGLSSFLSILNANERMTKNACHAGEERKSKNAQHSKRPCMHNKANKAAA